LNFFFFGEVRRLLVILSPRAASTELSLFSSGLFRTPLFRFAHHIARRPQNLVSNASRAEFDFPFFFASVCGHFPLPQTRSEAASFDIFHTLWPTSILLFSPSFSLPNLADTVF